MVLISCIKECATYQGYNNYKQSNQLTSITVSSKITHHQNVRFLTPESMTKQSYVDNFVVVVALLIYFWIILSDLGENKS